MLWRVSEVHEDGVALAAHLMSEYFISASYDGLWCMHSLTAAQRACAPTAGDWRIADGHIVALCGKDKTVHIWAAPTRTASTSTTTATAWDGATWWAPCRCGICARSTRPRSSVCAGSRRCALTRPGLAVGQPDGIAGE